MLSSLVPGRRVVITGIGLVTPLGCGSDLVWKRLLDGYSGVSKISEFEVPHQCSVSISAMVPRGKNIKNGEFDHESLFPKHSSKHVSRFISYAMYASDLALESSKIRNISEIMDPTKAGVAIGNGGIGSLVDITESHEALQQSYRKLSPYFVPKILTNMASGYVSIRHGLQGCVHSCTTACAAGTHSIGDAFNMIQMGYFDLMVCGGSDAIVDPLSIAGFARMKALSTTENPFEASRPFDVRRNGFVMGEGAGLLVLESLDSALARGAPIVAEVLGYGMSADAHHPTAPSADGNGAKRCMEMALQRAGVSPEEVGYINAHATSTPLGDAVEIEAIRSVFSANGVASSSTLSRQPLFVSSTKGSTGHLLGAAGAVETAFAALSVRDGVIPPTLNLNNIDPELSKENDPFKHVPLKKKVYEAETGTSLKYVLKNSFGFGGTNASLVLGKYSL